jgi:hypothetical protein
LPLVLLLPEKQAAADSGDQDERDWAAHVRFSSMMRASSFAATLSQW